MRKILRIDDSTNLITSCNNAKRELPQAYDCGILGRFVKFGSKDKNEKSDSDLKCQEADLLSV